MSEILLHYYKVNPTTWVYLSSLLMIGLYFKFGRFWSVRNLDLVLLLLLAPGLLMAQYGGEARVKATRLKAIEAESPADVDDSPHPDSASGVSDEATVEFAPPADEMQPEQPFPAAEDLPAEPVVAEVEETGATQPDDEGASEGDEEQLATTPAEILLQRSREIEGLGFIWLFAVGALLLVRLLLDPTMVRRPLLEPNLSSGGLAFLGCSLLVFLMANVIASDPAKPDSRDIETIEQIAPGDMEVDESDPGLARGPGRGPGFPLLNLIPSIPTAPLVPEGLPLDQSRQTYIWAAKAIAILCHFAVVLGIVFIAYWHFGDTKTGVGVATLYLMLPYTAQMTGHIDHVIPAALLVWAILCYRRPLTAGMLIGLATSLVYYPLFLLPLWISFYWRRGLIRFVTGVAATLLMMAISLVFIPEASYWENLKQMFGLWPPKMEDLEGFWRLILAPPYRIPVLAVCITLSGTLALWPAQKNLGTLLSCSAAVMVATQFWHGYGGGLYMAWYLPIALLTIFRPNLEDRVALAVLGESRMFRRGARGVGRIKAA